MSGRSPFGSRVTSNSSMRRCVACDVALDDRGRGMLCFACEAELRRQGRERGASGAEIDRMIQEFYTKPGQVLDRAGKPVTTADLDALMREVYTAPLMAEIDRSIKQDAEEAIIYGRSGRYVSIPPERNGGPFLMPKGVAKPEGDYIPMPVGPVRDDDYIFEGKQDAFEAVFVGARAPGKTQANTPKKRKRFEEPKRGRRIDLDE